MLEERLRVELLEGIDAPCVTRFNGKMNKRKPDYVLKHKVSNITCSNGMALTKIVKDVEKYLKAKERLEMLGIVPNYKTLTEDSFKAYLEAFEDIPGFILAETKRIVKAESQRNLRLRKRVSDMLQKNCVFVTLTFNDACLDSTTKEKRRRYVKDWLGALHCKYVANIDFGEKKEREHYHAIIQLDAIGSVDAENWRKYGAINFKRVIVSNHKALANYITKLTRHAIKKSTQREALIYSRD